MSQGGERVRSADSFSAATSAKPQVARGAWLAYAGGAFVVVLGLIVGGGLLLRGGGDTPGPGASDTPEPGGDVGPTWETAPEPTWNPTPLAGVNLPPMRDTVHPDEPAARVMEARIWDYVGPGWTLAVNRNGFGDASEPRDPNAFQALYLISPEEETFFLYKLRTDFWLGIEHWDPVERVAWIARYGPGDSWQTVELDLVPGDTTEDWVLDGGVARDGNNLAYFATLNDGTNIFAIRGYDFSFVRFVVRPATGPATMLGTFAGAETSDPLGYYATVWLDPVSTLAYYRVDTSADNGETYTSTWYTHDLATDTVAPMAVSPQEPPRGRCWSPGTLIDGYLVVNCAGGEDGDEYWLIDPTGVEPALAYSGAIPDLPTTQARWISVSQWDDAVAAMPIGTMFPHGTYTGP